MFSYASLVAGIVLSRVGSFRDLLANVLNPAFGPSYGKMHSEAVSEELLRTVNATLPLGELNVLQSPGAKGTGGAGAKKLIW